MNPSHPHDEGPDDTQAEIARLRRSDADRRRLVEMLPLGVFETDPSGLVAQVNPAMLELLGRERSAVVGYHFTKFLHPSDVARLVALRRDLDPSDMRSRTNDVRLLRADGGHLTVHVISTFLTNDGKPTGSSHGVVRDVTDERAAVDALRTSEERLRQVTENIREVFWLREIPSGKVLYISAAYEQVWGIPLSEMQADPTVFLTRILPEDVQLVRDLISGAGPTEVVFRIWRGGEIRWLTSRALPIRDETGMVYRLAGLTEDITERQQAVDKLREREAHYRRLVTTAPVCIYVLDAEGRITELNPAGEAILARTAEELLGRPFTDVIVPEDLALAREAFARSVAEGPPHERFELRVARPSGEQRLLTIAITAIREHDVVTGLHGIARDITVDRQRHLQLRRAERLATVGTLIGGVAHELNNPLTAVRGFAELMLAEHGRSGEDRETLELIRREAERMAKIVSDLRQMARQTQEGEGRRESVDFNDVVTHVLRVRRYTHETGNIRVDKDLAADLPPVVGNRAELEQVVLNLVINAEQALQSVESGDPCITVRTRLCNAGAALHVVDTGPGVPAALLERIFDPFFTTKAPGGGTGLGLSLVHSIIADHRGTVRVESDYGRGAEFIVELPRATSSDVTEPVHEIEHGASRKLRVLIVDDEMAIRAVVSRHLKRRGHDVDTAADGAEALSMIVEHGGAYDAILSDLRMPGIGGEQLLLELRKAGRRDRVIFMTGDAASGEAQRVIESTGTPVVLKPFALSDLSRLIEGS